MDESPEPSIGSLADTITTAGLVLNMVAVIAFALCIAGLAMEVPMLAISGGAVTLPSFVGSIVIIVGDGRRRDHKGPARAPVADPPSTSRERFDPRR